MSSFDAFPVAPLDGPVPVELAAVFPTRHGDDALEAVFTDRRGREMLSMPLSPHVIRNIGRLRRAVVDGSGGACVLTGTPSTALLRRAVEQVLEKVEFTFTLGDRVTPKPRRQTVTPNMAFVNAVVAARHREHLAMTALGRAALEAGAGAAPAHEDAVTFAASATLDGAAYLRHLAARVAAMKRERLLSASALGREILTGETAARTAGR
jgi:hypothetical protein